MPTNNPTPPDGKKHRHHRRRKPKPNPSKTKDNASLPKLIDRQPSMTDLTREAVALEKQLNVLKSQITPSRPGDGRSNSSDIMENAKAAGDELNYVRQSLKNVYQKILMADPVHAIHQRFDDKLWHYIFYDRIDHIRSRLRQTNKGSSHGHLMQSFLRHTDSAIKYYRQLNQRIKEDHGIDVKTIGIDLFKQPKPSSEEAQLAVLLQSNYIHMGDLARYRASLLSSQAEKKPSKDNWTLAKSYYQKAVDVYRANGKPYTQLALVALTSGSAIDVVWGYSMSISTKNPSKLGRDNLRSFYDKVRFSQTELPSPEDSGPISPTRGISRFVESLLQMHMRIMFSNAETTSPSFPSTSPLTRALTDLIGQGRATEEKKLPESLMQSMHILKNTLTRAIAVLQITIWDIGERMKSKENASKRSQFQVYQLFLLTFGFSMVTDVCKTSEAAMEDVRQTGTEDPICEQLEAILYSSILPCISTWCIFVSSHLALCEQFCRPVSVNDPRLHGAEQSRKLFKTTIQTFVSYIASHPGFPTPTDDILPSTYPLQEDAMLLGTMPLIGFHTQVDYLKHSTYRCDSNTEARKQVRWGRIRDLVRKMAESTTFDFVQYNASEQQYTVVDEDAKRRQQNRFMKAMAAQRLIEQVSSLEKNVKKMGMSSRLSETEADRAKPRVFTVVVDTTVFLDNLGKLKKWVNLTLNSNARRQRATMEVVVPLEVIDELDLCKKGLSHMNMQARESIRYLDQKLVEYRQMQGTEPARSFLRTQKVTEQLEWNETEQFWLGEEKEKAEEEKEEGENEEIEDDGASTTSESNDDLLQSRRSYDDSSDEENSNSSDEESELDEQDDEEVEKAEMKQGLLVQEEELDDDDEDEDGSIEPVSWAQVPKSFQPILRCVLYYLKHRKEDVILVSNDDELCWWACLFGETQTSEKLSVQSVREWDKKLATIR